MALLLAVRLQKEKPKVEQQKQLEMQKQQRQQKHQQRQNGICRMMANHEVSLDRRKHHRVQLMW